MAPFDGKYLTSNLMAKVMLLYRYIIYEIFVNQIKCQNFDLENEGQGEKRDLRHSSGNIRFHIGDFFQNFKTVSTWEHMFTQTWTDTLT